jgi:hypothetical protein
MNPSSLIADPESLILGSLILGSLILGSLILGSLILESLNQRADSRIRSGISDPPTVIQRLDSGISDSGISDSGISDSGSVIQDQ